MGSRSRYGDFRLSIPLLLPMRRHMQSVVQNAGKSFNPRFSAFDSIVDPLRNLLGIKDAGELRRRCGRALRPSR